MVTTALAFGSGALSGGLAASGVGIIGQIAFNGMIAGGQNFIEQTVDNKGDISKTDFAQLGTSFAVGMLSGLLGGKGADNGQMKALTQQLGKRIAHAFEYKTGDALKKEIIKACTYYLKNSGTLIKQVRAETIKAIFRSSIPSVYDLGKDVYEKIAQEINDGLK